MDNQTQQTAARLGSKDAVGIPMQRYEWNDPAYSEAFSILLRSTGGDTRGKQLLRSLLKNREPRDVAVDRGAGFGGMSEIMLEYVDNVYSVEPDEERRSQIAIRCPGATVIDGTITSFLPPRPVNVGLISHVFYHIPDHKWGAYTMRAASHLASGGSLMVSLKGPDSGASKMVADLGGPPFDLYRGLADVMRTSPDFDFTWARGTNRVTTTSFDDTVKIARFMLCDRDEDAFIRPLTEAGFIAYVRDHLWNEEAGTGGWPATIVYCIITRRQ